MLRHLDEVAASLVALQGKLHARILRIVTGDPLDRLGISWDITHPLSAALLAQAGQRTGERLVQAVQPVLRATLEGAYTQGLSVEETSALIQAKLTEAAPWQADMLARTDLNGLANGGSVIAAKLAGAGYKTWLATMDDRTRETHAEADGQTVPVDAPFQVGGEPLDFPGDPSGSDAEVANCRCTVTYGDVLTAAATPTLTAGGSMATIAQTRWVSDLALEGEATSDGRYFLAGSWSWRQPPLTLMAQTVTAEGHNGAFVAGRIDTIGKRTVGLDGEVLGEGVKAVRGAGVFDMGGAEGADVARLVADETLRGISVDYAVLDWCFRDPATGDLIEKDEATPQDLERYFMGDLQFAARKAEILAATVCPTPAFARTRIALAASGDHRLVRRLWAPIQLEEPKEKIRVELRPVSAGPWQDGAGRPLTAAASPAKPPREWFETQEPPGKMPLTISDDGRVFGHLATWDTCHTGIENVCTTPPRSQTGYAYFHVAEIETDDGAFVTVGKLMLGSKGGRHASLAASMNEARSHYDDSSMVAAYLRATDGRFGIWVAGALNPRLGADRVRELRTLPPSGDWREVNGRLEMITALAVPVPGFPVPRAEAALIASANTLSLSALVASSGVFDPSPGVLRALAEEGLIAEDYSEERTRTLVALAEGGIDGLVALATEGGHQ